MNKIIDDLKQQYQLSETDSKYICSVIKENELCMGCENIKLINNGKLKRGLKINKYNGYVRALLCEDCNNFESKIRKLIDEQTSYADLKKLHGDKKIDRMIHNVYAIHGIVPMMIDT